MACPDEQQFVDFLDEGLDLAARGQLHDHVSDCPSCRHLLAALGRARGDSRERVAHYQIEGIVGRGGMGVVYRAVDTRIRRTVALKVLSPHLVGDEHATERLLREARAAGALDHPNVAQVFEIGNDGELGYIALAFYEGETLRDRLLGERLDPREAATLLHQMALGLGCAHAAGIVHRDVKPSNVLITSSGVRLVDFGLAKVVDATTELTEPGQVLGTVAYMPPEQAKGETDARGDVWSLGVTGYEMLAGTRPFPGTTALAILNAAASFEPPPPPGPPALQAIIMKCLEKDPALRYADGSEVARDLARFLGGERVSARAPGLAHRAKRFFAGERRRTTTALILAGLAALTATGIVVRARRSEHLRVERAERLGQAAQRMRMSIKNAYLLPLHDTSPERKAVRAEMGAISDELRRLGPDDSGLAEYALGSGAAALKDYDAARAHLEAAWNAGQRRPEVAYALALALVYKYGERREDLRRVPPAERAAAAKKLAEEIRDPALSYLHAAEGEGPPGAVEALIAVYEDREADALRLTHEVFARAPSEYELGELNARMLMYRAFGSWYAGEKSAIDQFTALEESFKRVLAVSRSDPRMYVSTAIRTTRMSSMRSDSGVPHVEDSFQRAIAYAEQGEIAGPDDVETYNAHVDALVNFGLYTQLTGGDPRPIFRRAVEVGEAGLRIDPDHWKARFNHGMALSRLGNAQLGHGEDGRPLIRQGIAELEKSLAQHDYEDTYHQLSSALWKLGDMEMRHGDDARATYDRAIGYMRKTLAIDATNPNVLGSLGALIGQRIQYEIEQGRDPKSFLAEAMPLLEQAERVAVQDDYPPSMIAYVKTLEARYQLATGADPKAAVERAIAEARRAVDLNKIDPDPPGYLADALRLRAIFEQRSGANGAASIASARESMALSLKRAHPSPDYIARIDAHVELTEPVGKLDRARGVVKELLDRDGEDLDALLFQVELHRRAKECSDGDRVIARASSVNPRSARVLWAQADLDESCAHVDAASQTERLARAKSSRAEALRLDPLIARDPG
jgi:hypothetical protein